MRLVARALLAIATLLASPEAHAQCGAGLSQCRNCHEIRGAHPVQLGSSTWHMDHVFADLCAACHGGDPQAVDEGIAHARMTAPLADVRATCGPCHGAASNELAQRYSDAPKASGTVPVPPPHVLQPPRVAWPNVVLAAMVLLVGGGGAAYVVRNERGLRAGGEKGGR
jgi:hypothetical protein